MVCFEPLTAGSADFYSGISFLHCCCFLIHSFSFTTSDLFTQPCGRRHIATPICQALYENIPLLMTHIWDSQAGSKDLHGQYCHILSHHLLGALHQHNDQMATAMRPGSVWIERGPDGRPYFVRRKPPQPSTRQLLAEALLPRSSRSFFSRDSRQNNHIQCVDPETRLLMPPPSSSPAPAPGLPTAPGPSSPHPSQSQQPQPIAMYLVPPTQNQNMSEAAGNQPQSIMKPQPQVFPHYPPNIFPMPMMQQLPAQNPPFNPPFIPQQPFMGQGAPFAAAPPGAFPVQPQQAQQPQQHTVHQPPQRQLAPGLGNPQDLRYKCDICGRFRSARYHYEHPIPPGQPPPKTVCRKCMDKATESEDESSSDGHRSRKTKHRTSRARSWKSSLFGSLRRGSPPRRARSRSRGKYIDNSYDRYKEPSYSEASSSSLEDAHIPSRQRRYRRPKSPESAFPQRFQNLRLVPQERDVYFEHVERGRRPPRSGDGALGGGSYYEVYRR